MGFSKSEKTNLEKLGNHIRSIRTQKGLTLKELAYAIGKDPQSIGRVERGEINTTYLYLLELCQGLEVDIKELVDF